MVMHDLPRERLETLADATLYLEGLINHERLPGFEYARLDLAAIDALLAALGRPQDSLSVLHVAGSKGKGSTCLFAESILLALGDSVGTFTSPHLESWVERFRVDGRPIDDARLVAAVDRVRPKVEALRAGPPETRPSFFDATTAVAILLFAEAGVDHAILEVGLGGRLDSTNIVTPAVTCITSIELEHTDKLGETEAEIAGEKAGILKPRAPLILGELRAEADAVIRARAAKVGAPIRACGEAFEVTHPHDPKMPEAFPWAAQTLHFRSPPDFEFEAALAMSGRPALVNAGLAVECIRALGRYSDAAIANAAGAALSKRRLPGRIEILKGDPEVIIDSAHTAESARALAAVLAQIAPEGFELLLSVSADKNLGGVLDALLPSARRVWVTRAEPLRSLPPEALAEFVRERAPSLPIEVIDDPEKAAGRARDGLPPGIRLCATGSIYLAGVARRVLRDWISRLDSAH
jgi:dihydrofolate synthase / folylpolyglutamate synthase